MKMSAVGSRSGLTLAIAGAVLACSLTIACSRSTGNDEDSPASRVDALLETGDHAEALRVIEIEGLDATAAGRRLKAEALILAGQTSPALDLLADETIVDREVLIDDACVIGVLRGDEMMDGGEIRAIVERCRTLHDSSRIDRRALELRALVGTPEHRCERVLEFIRGP